MTCQDVNQFLADYLDGTLPWRQRLLFNVHLLVCHHCRQYLASYAATVRFTKSLGQQVEPEAPYVPDELVRAVLSAQPPRIKLKADGQPPRELL